MPVSNFTADDVLTAANMNLLPRGVMAYAQVTANQTGISTVVDLTSLTVTFTAVAGRRYRITGFGLITQRTGTGTATMTITNSANVQQAAAQSRLTGADNEMQTATPMFVVVPGAGSITYKLRLTTNASTCDLTATGTNPAFILAEDIGV